MARKKKYNYFEAFGKQAELVVEEAEILVDLIKTYREIDDMGPILAKAHEIETAGDYVNHDTYNAIATDFVTPIDRDDLVDISSSLDNIIDELENTIQLFWIMDVHQMHERCLEFIEEMLLKACCSLREAINELPDYKKSEKFGEAIKAVNDWEEVADQAYMEIMHDLFAGEKNEPLYVVRWVRIFDKLESCCDACEHVSDVMETVVLKD